MVSNRYTFISDSNEIELVEAIDRDGRVKLPETLYVFKYTKSSTKLGFLIRLSEARINDMISKGIIKPN